MTQLHENCHAEHSEASRLDFNELEPRFLLPVVVRMTSGYEVDLHIGVQGNCSLCVY